MMPTGNPAIPDAKFVRVAVVPEMVAVGIGLTVTVVVAVLEHPLALLKV